MIGNFPFQDAITEWKNMFHAWEIQNKRTCRTLLWFYVEPCRAEKHVQEDKTNMCRIKLNGGYLAAPNCGWVQAHCYSKWAKSFKTWVQLP
jgi:hypothetical protein